MKLIANCQRIPPHGSILIEVTLGFALTATLALLMMRASLLAISGNQWTIMQTLTDSYLSRESALSNRIPYADLTSSQSPWPNLTNEPASEQTVTIGRVAGGHLVQGTLKRFRTAESAAGAVTQLALWRLPPVLHYKLCISDIVKSRSKIRCQ